MNSVSLMAWRVSDERKTVRNVESPSAQACAMTLAKGNMMSNATWRNAKAMSNRRAHVGSEIDVSELLLFIFLFFAKIFIVSWR